MIKKKDNVWEIKSYLVWPNTQDSKNKILFEDLLHCWRQNISAANTLTPEHVDRRVFLQKNEDISDCGQ